MSDLDRSIKNLANALETLESKIEQRLAGASGAHGQSSGEVSGETVPQAQYAQAKAQQAKAKEECDQAWDQMRMAKEAIASASTEIGDIINEAKALLASEDGDASTK